MQLDSGRIEYCMKSGMARPGSDEKAASVDRCIGEKRPLMHLNKPYHMIIASKLGAWFHCNPCCFWLRRRLA
jgi:hypothetical protein